MMYKHSFWLRASGLAGILGGLILFAGDMLIYYDPQSTDLLQNMATIPPWRFRLSTVTALLATWFYLAGVYHVFLAFRPAPVFSHTVVAVTFAAILSAYGVVHGEFMAIAGTARIAAQQGLDLQAASGLARSSNDLLRLWVYPVFAILSVVFIYEVWKKRTLYPRLIILFFPLFPFAFMGPLDKVLTDTAHTVILGGYLNLMLVLFFAASTVALWKER